jgi:hypothetical protein
LQIIKRFEKEKNLPNTYPVLGQNPAGNRVRPGSRVPSPTPAWPSQSEVAQPKLACPSLPCSPAGLSPSSQHGEESEPRSPAARRRAKSHSPGRHRPQPRWCAPVATLDSFPSCVPQTDLDGDRGKTSNRRQRKSNPNRLLVNPLAKSQIQLEIRIGLLLHARPCLRPYK